MSTSNSKSVRDDDLSQLNQGDLVTLNREMAVLSGVKYAGVDRP
ncbi:hypothetical protein [Vibrio alfacsensis]|nr:hypothetical protein [Vibrio alfacsensis]